MHGNKLKDVENRLRASVVCVHSGKILVFKAVDPTSKQEYFFLPGGKVEEWENRRACAERETKEETGFRVVVQPRAEVRKDYFFKWDGVDYFCKTYFFRAELLGNPDDPSPVNDAAYNKGAQWISVEEIPKIFAYHREILAAVLELAAGA